MSENLKKILDALGAIAEMAGVIRDRMMDNGFSREEAVAAASMWLVHVCGETRRRDEE